jgi:YidC/Oxa1 family membrane protein insertase
MVFIHDHIVGGSWGLAIIGLTVVIRAVLVPLTFRQLKSMQEMQKLAPEIQALKEKYKDDKQRQQQELMKFYQENKINPLASCLPLLLQIPVFISLFYMLRTDLKFDICGPQMKVFYTKELGRPILKNSQVPEHATHVAAKTVHVGNTTVHTPAHVVKGISELGCSQIPGAEHSAKFLFIPDITLKATGAVLAVLIVAYVASQVASTLMATATADPTQRRLMLFLPIIFVIILYRYPAGLLVYWITTNVWTIGQQYLIRRHMGPPAPMKAPARDGDGKRRSVLRPALAAGGGGGGGGGSGSSNAGSSNGAEGKGTTTKAPTAAAKSAPPPPPRKKKKRSGRRR